MSECLHFFENGPRRAVVSLPFPLEEVLGQWGQLRAAMVRNVRPEFARDEWAYLIAFLDEENLRAVFSATFGQNVSNPSGLPQSVYRPRGAIAIWLPNNVSLLGPLTLILLSLTGNSLRLKGGSSSDDLTGIFLEFARQHILDGALKNHLAERVTHEVFGREDPRHREMAAIAQVRVVFGSDAAAEVIHQLPHPLESIGFSFVDRRSEAWIQKEAVTDALLTDLLKVFAIYGQAGCTSPRRVVLLDATQEETIAFRDRLLSLWPQVIKRPPAMHIASGNVMSRQCAAAQGWDARLTANHGAVLAVGGVEQPEFPSLMGLMIVGGNLEQALATLPGNIQTVGYGFTNPAEPGWLELVARSGIKRLVALGLMHHFGPVWDGQAFWRQAFEEVEFR